VSVFVTKTTNQIEPKRNGEQAFDDRCIGRCLLFYQLNYISINGEQAFDDRSIGWCLLFIMKNV